MSNLLLISQILVSVFLITFILLQQRGTALGSSFGGEGGSFYSTRRGIQKKIYWGAIVCGILFIVLGVLNLLF